MPTSGGGPLGRGRSPGGGHWGKGVTADETATTWLRPEIEAEIKFTEWTTGSFLRHAEFVTLREA